MLMHAETVHDECAMQAIPLQFLLFTMLHKIHVNYYLFNIH